MTRSTEQRSEALKVGNAKRAELSRVKAGVASGEIPFPHLFTKYQPLVENVLLVDLVRWLPKFGDVKLRNLCARAVKDQINLGVTLGRASKATRAWVLVTVKAPGTHELVVRDWEGAARTLIELIRSHEAQVKADDPDWGTADDRLWGAVKDLGRKDG